MAEEENNQPSQEADSEEPEGSDAEEQGQQGTSEGTKEEAVGGEDELLSELRKELGKEDADKDEVLKSVKGLKELVGDQKTAEDRKKAEEYEQLKQRVEQDPQYRELHQKVQRMEFEKTHPEAMDYYDEVVAKAEHEGTDPISAYENSKIKELVESSRQNEQQRQENRQSLPKSDNQPTGAESVDEEVENAVNEAKQNYNFGPLLKHRLKKRGVIGSSEE